LLCQISKQAHHQAIERFKKQLEKEELYVRLIEQTREIHPGMGLRTIYEMLQPEGIGRDAFIALGVREGFRVKPVENYTRTTYSSRYRLYKNLLAGKQFTDVNQLWTSDLTYLFCLGRFYYIVLLMDLYSRRIIGYSVADNMRVENSLTALQRALTLRGVLDYHSGLIHHSDKGVQYTSDAYTETLKAYGIQISMCDEVYENAHHERVNDTIKNQYLNRMSIATEQELKTKVAGAIESYNNTRPHLSLNKLSPIQFETKIKSITMENRSKLEVYTVNKDEAVDPDQLNLDLI
jgi:transposase InsO family protein